jgi:hypothetical protein
MSSEERKASSFIQSIELSGPLMNDMELTKAVVELMEYIFKYYVMDEDNVFYLKDETCNTCHFKLVRKDVYEKEINLPGGSSIFLKFYRYSCSNCKKPIDRKLSLLFEPNKQYSKNIKSDAVRLYSKHLSSYDLVVEEINKIYCLNIDKKTIMQWIKEEGVNAEQIIKADHDFSGHFLYDEEYMKVFVGNVGIKGAKLEWIQVYLLLFRDAITKKCIVRIVSSLSEEILFIEWKEFILDMHSKGIPIISFGTDGKREYPEYIHKLNIELKMNIRHVYDAFHFQKNLYESANEQFFGAKNTKKTLPEHIINQINLIESFFDTSSKEEAKKYLQDTLIFQKQTFDSSLRPYIEKLNTYFDNYTYFFEVPEMKTTNLCESWFHRTKPEKLKHGYKTKFGLTSIANLITIRINYNLARALNLEFDYNAALNVLLGSLKAKIQSRYVP